MKLQPEFSAPLMDHESENAAVMLSKNNSELAIARSFVSLSREYMAVAKGNRHEKSSDELSYQIGTINVAIAGQPLHNRALLEAAMSHLIQAKALIAQFEDEMDESLQGLVDEALYKAEADKETEVPAVKVEAIEVEDVKAKEIEVPAVEVEAIEVEDVKAK